MNFSFKSNFTFTLVALAAVAAGCATTRGGIRWAEGDPQAGREVFQEARCFTCHVIPGEDFLPPVVDPAITLSRGWGEAGVSPAELARIIETSHDRRPQPMEEYAEDPPPSMSEFTADLTDRQMVDLVAYLRQSPAEQPY